MLRALRVSAGEPCTLCVGNLGSSGRVVSSVRRSGVSYACVCAPSVDVDIMMEP